MIQEGNVKNQFLGVFFLLLNTVSNGALGAWPSPSLPLLMSTDSPLDSGSLTIEQASWVVSLFSPGCILGIIVIGWMMDQYGRKLSGCFLTLPQLTAWLLVYVATNEVYLYFARFLNGFAAGAMFVLIPIYVTEISVTRIRGLLGSLLVVFVNAGMLLGFITGAYLDYRAVPWMFLPLSIASFVGFCFFPETPTFLSKQNRHSEAEKSIRFYRGLSNTDHAKVVLEELTNLKNLTSESSETKQEGLSISDFNLRPVRKACMISIGLATLNQVCGCVALVQYAAMIFEKAGSTLSPNVSAIVVGLIQVVGAYCSTLFVEKAGRKVLMVFSAFGISLGQLSLALYSYLEVQGVNVAPFKVIPFVSFCLVVFSASMGVLCLPFVIMSEMLPAKVKTVATSFCLLFLNAIGFLVLKFLPWMMINLGLHGMVFTFAVASFLGGIFVLVLLPETKGKSLIEISNMLCK